MINFYVLCPVPSSLDSHIVRLEYYRLKPFCCFSSSISPLHVSAVHNLLCTIEYSNSNFFKHVIHTGLYICRSRLLFSSPGIVHGSYTQSLIELGTYSFCNDFCVLMSFFSLSGMASFYNSLANPIHSFQFTCHFTKPSLVDVIYKYKKYLFSGCYNARHYCKCQGYRGSRQTLMSLHTSDLRRLNKNKYHDETYYVLGFTK